MPNNQEINLGRVKNLPNEITYGRPMPHEDLASLGYDEFEKIGALFKAIHDLGNDETITQLAKIGQYLCLDMGNIFDYEHERVTKGGKLQEVSK